MVRLYALLAVLISFVLGLSTAVAYSSLTGEVEFTTLMDHKTNQKQTVPFLYRNDTGQSVMLIGLDSEGIKNGDKITVHGTSEVDYFYVDTVQKH